MDMRLFLMLLVSAMAISFVPLLLNWPCSRALVLSLAAFACLLGGLLAATLVIGLGAGDTWVVYPPWVTWDAWLLPVGLLGFAVVVFSWVFTVPGWLRRNILYAAYVLLPLWIALAVLKLVKSIWAASMTAPAMASRGGLHRNSPTMEKVVDIGFAVFLVALGVVWLLLVRHSCRRIDGPGSYRPPPAP
jgi:hypothetical protein